MTIRHHDDVLILLVVGAPYEQLSDASLDGTVSVGSLADVADAFDVTDERLALGGDVAQLAH